MSHLETVARAQLKDRKQFTFLGDDGVTVQANDYNGVLSVVVTDNQGKTLFDHYTDFKVLLRHLEMHGGHVH